jgi:hypothetical protein
MQKRKEADKKRRVIEDLPPELLSDRKKREADRIRSLRQNEESQSQSGVISPTKVSKNVATSSLSSMPSTNVQQSRCHIRTFEKELQLLNATNHPNKTPFVIIPLR